MSVPPLAQQQHARIANVIDDHRAMEQRKHTSPGRKLLYILGGVTAGVAAIGAFGYVKDTYGQREVPETVSSDQFYEYASPANYSIPFEDLTLRGANGAKLKAWHFKAKEPNAPTVVYLHGEKCDAAWMLPQLANLYQKTKCNMLVLNYRNCKLNSTSTDIKTAIADVSAALTQLQKAQDTDVAKENVILLGTGTGAQVAVDVATRLNNPTVGGLILENPRQGVPLSEVNTEWINTLRWFVPGWLKNLCTRLVPSAPELLNKNKLPVMFYADEKFSTSVAKNWFMKSGSPNRFLVTPGAWPHGPNRAELDDQWLSLVSDFVTDVSNKKNLGVQIRAI